MLKFRKKDKIYRILSIDGGGLKGIFTAYAIWKLEEEYDIKILDHFDMIVGTSTGALIAFGILAGKSGKDIYDVYSSNENQIFKNKKGFGEQFKSVFFAGYDSKAIEDYITEEVGTKTLKDLYIKSQKDFAFFASNFTKARPVVYGSPSLSGSELVKTESTLFEALRTSTAAPFYFEPLIEKDTGYLILDGGLWANNPSLAGINLASSEKEANINKMEVLSFGQTFTQDVLYKITKGRELMKSPLKHEFVQLLMSTLTLNQNSQTILVKNLLGKRVYRYEPELFVSGVTLNTVSQKFVNYTKFYWEENKESLVKFIKTGENTKK